MASALSHRRWLRLGGWGALTLVLAATSGCRHHRTQTQMSPPDIMPPAEEGRPAPENYPSGRRAGSLGPIAPTPLPPGGVSQEDLEFVATHKPFLTEYGEAAWYTAPYKGRRAANGQVFDDNAMATAHRTLPMGSLVEVTNVKTGQSAVMRVADRGPFTPGRIVDLTKAAARATGVYWAGLAQVRLDVYRTPKPVETGGRWCVQIGGFKKARNAEDLKQQLLRQYPTARVITFPGMENNVWVRIRPEGDSRALAEFIAGHMNPTEGAAFLTRMD